MIAFFALLSIVCGLLLFVMSQKPKLAEIGRIIFMGGVLMLVGLIVITLVSKNVSIELF